MAGKIRTFFSKGKGDYALIIFYLKLEEDVLVISVYNYFFVS